MLHFSEKLHACDRVDKNDEEHEQGYVEDGVERVGHCVGDYLHGVERLHHFKQPKQSNNPKELHHRGLTCCKTARNTGDYYHQIKNIIRFKKVAFSKRRQLYYRFHSKNTEKNIVYILYCL